MLAGVAAVIFDVVINMARPILKKKRLLPIAVMLTAFVATRFFSVNIILIILVCGGIGALDTLYLKKKEIEDDLSGTVLEFLSSRPVQHRRRVCSHAFDSGPGRGDSPLADDDGICGYYGNRRNDPGAYRLNAATFVGIQVAGLPGALIATIGCIFPSCVIVMALAYVYYRFRGLSVMQGILAGLRPASLR